MSIYGSYLTEGLFDVFKSSKEVNQILEWNKKANKLKFDTENIKRKYKSDKDRREKIDFKSINLLIEEHDKNIDSWKSGLGKYFDNYYNKYIIQLYKYLKEQISMYGKSNKVKSKKTRTNYTIDVNKISFNEARDILCKDIKKACYNCNKDPEVKKQLIKGLEKMRKTYKDSDIIEKESKEIEKYINNNNFFKFEDGGDYFSVCRSYQTFICCCYPQYIIGEELERISSFEIGYIDYGDGDEGCLYISPYTD